MTLRFRAPQAHDITLAEGPVTTDSSGRFRVTLPGDRRRFARVLKFEAVDTESPERVRMKFEAVAKRDEIGLGTHRIQ